MADWKDILDKAKEETNKELISEIKSLTILSEDEIMVIAPSDLDKTKLRDLLVVIKDATKSNEEKNKVIKDLVEGSNLLIHLVGKIL